MQSSTLPLLPPPYTLHPVLIPSDLPSLTSLGALSFSNDASQKAVLGTIDPQSPAHLSWRRRGLEKALTSQDGRRRAHYVKCCVGGGGDDGKEEIVAYAGWWAPRDERGEEGKEEMEGEEEKGEEEVDVEGVDTELQRRMIGEIIEAAGRILGEGWETEYWNLRSLATHPSHRRRGLASSLIQWGISLASADAATHPEKKLKGTYLFATPDGLSTYLKNGFREVGSLVQDIGAGKEEGKAYKLVLVVRGFD